MCKGGMEGGRKGAGARKVGREGGWEEGMFEGRRWRGIEEGG